MFIRWIICLVRLMIFIGLFILRIKICLLWFIVLVWMISWVVFGISMKYWIILGWVIVIGLFVWICFLNRGMIEFEEFKIFLKCIMVKMVVLFLLVRVCSISFVICLFVFMIFVGCMVLFVEIRVKFFMLVFIVVLV